MIVAELIAIGFFTLWPVPKSSETFRDVSLSENAIAMEDVVITNQGSQPPPPPKPQVPIPVPNDEVIEEEIITMENLDITDFSDPMSTEMMGSQGDESRPMANPQVSPSIIRIVEPSVPEAAKKAEVKAEIWVSFLVDTEGKVEEASIAQIKLYDRKTGEVKTVDTIDYGLTEATLDAALQWKFRPAKNEGEPVKAYTRHIFTFGF